MSLDTAADPHGLSPVGPEGTTQQLTHCSATSTSPKVDRTASTGSLTSRSASEMQNVGLLGQLRGAAARDKDAMTEVLDSSDPVKLLVACHAVCIEFDLFLAITTSCRFWCDLAPVPVSVLHKCLYMHHSKPLQRCTLS